MKHANLILGLLAAVGLSACHESGWSAPYDDAPGYEEIAGSRTRLSVEVESVDGTVQGLSLGTEHMLGNYGEMMGRSAHFALSTGEEPPTPRWGPTEAPAVPEELTVTLDICPIEEIVNAGPLSATETDFAYLTVCREGWCRDASGENLEIEVIETSEGPRVLARAVWDETNEVAVQLRYVLTDETIDEYEDRY